MADQPRRYPAVSRRLLQLFVAAVYFGAATTKVHIPAYFTGLQLQTWMITEYNVPNFLGSHFAMYPSLLVVMGDVAICWEILFIFLAWRGIGRITMIGLGVLFHMMTWLTLGLWVFPLVCYSGYFAFMNESDVEWIRGVLERWRARGRGLRAAVGRILQGRELWTLPAIQPSWSYGTFTALAVLTTIGGVGLEHNLDPYGIRRPQGPYALRKWTARSSTKCSRRRAASATKTRCSCSTSGPCCWAVRSSIAARSSTKARPSVSSAT